MFVKICGCRKREAAGQALSAGADAIGINLVPGSVRCVTVAEAGEIARAASSSEQVFWIVATPPTDFLSLVADFPLSRVQRVDPAWNWPDGMTHARRVEVAHLQQASDVAAVLPASLVVSDSASGVGGSGQLASWEWSAQLARRQRILLAGGLTPDNVKAAIAAVQPFGVDVASGVERRPGEKDPQLVERFIHAAKDDAAKDHVARY